MSAGGAHGQHGGEVMYAAQNNSLQRPVANTSRLFLVPLEYFSYLENGPEQLSPFAGSLFWAVLGSFDHIASL